MKTPFRNLLITLSATAALAACHHDTKPTQTTQSGGGDTTTTAPAVAEGRYTTGSLDTDACLRRRVIYFDLDKTDIHGEFESMIACHAAYLRQFPGAKVTLEGNTDERGTRDYNQGLGERRGNAVASALAGAGASSGQINVVSYGEERPVCREHNEGCWQKNRRVEVVYTSKQ